MLSVSTFTHSNMHCQPYNSIRVPVCPREQEWSVLCTLIAYRRNETYILNRIDIFQSASDKRLSSWMLCQCTAVIYVALKSIYMVFVSLFLDILYSIKGNISCDPIYFPGKKSYLNFFSFAQFHLQIFSFALVGDCKLIHNLKCLRSNEALRYCAERII